MKKRIQRRLPFGPCLPARVDPHPLVRMPPDDLLDHFCKALGILKNVALFIAGSRQRDFRLEPQAVFP